MKACQVLLATVVLVPGMVSAEELWSPHLSGYNAGTASGASLPQGTYFFNTTDSASTTYYDNSGHKTERKSVGFIEVPEVYIVPDLQILGGQYSALFNVPWDRVNLTPGPGEASLKSSGFFSYVVSPMNLSWSLPNNFHVSTGVQVYIPNGDWKKPSIQNPKGNFSSIDFWAYEPSIGLSWLKDGWNLSTKLWYDYNEKNQDMNYRSGNVFGTEETVSKDVGGGLTLGVVGYTRDQVSDDKGAPAPYVMDPIIEGKRQHDYGAGPLVAYNFGFAYVQAWYEHSFGTKNSSGGDQVFTRFVVPLDKLAQAAR